jgi:hypothetical protein
MTAVIIHTHIKQSSHPHVQFEQIVVEGDAVSHRQDDPHGLQSLLRRHGRSDVELQLDGCSLVGDEGEEGLGHAHDGQVA